MDRNDAYRAIVKRAMLAFSKKSPEHTAALDRVREIAAGYSTLEYDLSAGARGSRQDHLADVLRGLVGETSRA